MTDLSLTSRLETGRYMDQAGRVWLCIVRESDVVCDSDGWFTCAYHDTFRKWGWKPVALKEHPTHD